MSSQTNFGETKRTGTHLWLTLARMTGVQIAATSAVLALTALAPVVAETLNVGAYWVGYQVSFIYFAGLFASLGAGSLVARLRSEAIIAVELGLLIVGLALLATAIPALMVLASVLLGLAYGINNPASSVILQEVTPARRRSLVFSLKQSGVPLGAVVANAFLPLVALWLSGWQTAVLALAVVPLALLPSTLRQMERSPDRARMGGPGILATALAEQRAVLGDASLRTLAALGCLFSALQLTVTAFAVVSLVEIGWSIPAAGLVGAALQIAGASGRVLWGVVADRFGPFWVLSLLGFAGGTLSLLLYFQPVLPTALLAVVLVCLGACASGWNGVFLAAIARASPPGRVGAATGAILSYTFIGVIVGPSLFAAIYHALGSYPLCFAVVSVAGLAGGALAARRHRLLKMYGHNI
ncbi:MFS transporter [Sulfitobacter sp. LCG007]